MKAKHWLISAVALMFISAIHAQEPDYPRAETLYPLQGDISGSVLHLDCLPRNDETLDCEKMQVIFVKPNVEDQYTEEEFQGLLREMDEEICQSGIPWTELSSGDPEIQARLAEASPSQAQNIERMLRFCTESSGDVRSQVLRQMLSESEEQQRSTCGLTFLNSTDQFSWDPSTGQWRSVVEGDSCGAVTISTLESEDGIWWSYTTRTLITDPDGEAPFPLPSCDVLANNEPLIWAGNGNSIRQNCEVIGEAWTQ